MMAACLVLALIVSQNLETWMPLDIIGILSHFITHPKITHFHAPRTLTCDGVIGDAEGRCIVAMNGGFGLWMSEFFEGEPKNHAFFAVQEEGTYFGYGGGCNDKT